MPHFINSNCTTCGACLAECPSGSIFAGRKQYVIDSDTCQDHDACTQVCPVDAITYRSIGQDMKLRYNPDEDHS